MNLGVRCPRDYLLSLPAVCPCGIFCPKKITASLCLEAADHWLLKWLWLRESCEGIIQIWISVWPWTMRKCASDNSATGTFLSWRMLPWQLCQMSRRVGNKKHLQGGLIVRKMVCKDISLTLGWGARATESQYDPLISSKMGSWHCNAHLREMGIPLMLGSTLVQIHFKGDGIRQLRIGGSLLYRN